MQQFQENVKIPGIRFGDYDNERGRCRRLHYKLELRDYSFESMARRLVQYYNSLPDCQYFNTDRGQVPWPKIAIHVILVAGDPTWDGQERTFSFYFVE